MAIDPPPVRPTSPHGYELRTRIAALTGHIRPIAEGTLYPKIKRMEQAGLLHRTGPSRGTPPRTHPHRRGTHRPAGTATRTGRPRHQRREPLVRRPGLLAPP
ncbi:PadR family transcriptional regulator [Amycolatopsis rhizosphaerae]|uniref:PadR family transcriptional regulator n=1 Tax=Amycolatopsis rhizosphaerae TaxID=2053003 RepID=UPI001C942B76